MAKKKDKKKSLARNRSKRKFQNDKLEKRIKTGQERSQSLKKNIIDASKDVTMLVTKDGDHIMDIIPYEAGRYDPLVEKGDPTHTFEYWAHPNVGPNNAMMLCPTEMYGKECPICEHREKLRNRGADDEKWKGLFPKRRNLYNVICYDRGEEKKGVQLWDISYHYFEKFILAISKKTARGKSKAKTINFAHPEKGKSINFTIEPAKSKNDYPTYLGHAFDDRDYEIEEETLEEAQIIDEIVYRPNYEEIKKAYYGGKKGKDDDSSKGEGDEEKTELLDELEDIDDFDDFKEFIDDNDIDVKIKKRMDDEDIKDKIIEAIEEKFEGEGNGDDYTAEDIRGMKKRKLLDFIDDEDVDVDPDDADDTEELQDLVIEEMELEED